MIHRHLRVPPGTRPEALPSAAIVDILERGDLEEWRPLAAIIVRDPFGGLADRVMHLIDASPMYGTSPLWRSWIHACRTRAEGARPATSAAGLSGLRRHMGLTQVELSGRMGMSQSDLSKLERRRDVRLSSLTAYARALGGALRIRFDLDGEQAEIRWGD